MTTTNEEQLEAIMLDPSTALPRKLWDILTLAGVPRVINGVPLPLETRLILLVQDRDALRVELEDIYRGEDGK